MLGMESCKSSTEKQNSMDSSPSGNSKTEKLPEEKGPVTNSPSEKPEGVTDFAIPTGYMLFDKVQGDLNGDGLDDYVLVVKGTNNEMIIQDENRGALDRNRRGVMIYLTNEEGTDLITQNLSCFSSENEDGGVYFPPELSLEIKKGKLFIHYSHGRYGYWKYTFRYQYSHFELIGYDSSDNYGPIVNRETSINFLTKKKLVRENTNQDAEDSGEEVFEEKWEEIEIDALLSLSKIKDFDLLEAD